MRLSARHFIFLQHSIAHPHTPIRAGVMRVLLPAGNRPDYEELGEEVRAGVDVHFVEVYREVYRLALGDAAEATSRSNGSSGTGAAPAA